MKIFCVGLNKTGTTSLHEAFLILGIRSSHDHVVHEREVAKWRSRGRSWKLFKNFPDVEAFSNGPFHKPDVVEALFRSYPGAKFIRTARDKNDWVLSRMTHNLVNLYAGRQERPFSTVATRKEWADHKRYMLKWKGHPRFLHWRLVHNPSWKPLCDFLGLPIPDEPFPHVNAASSRLRRLVERIEKSNRRKGGG